MRLFKLIAFLIISTFSFGQVAPKLETATPPKMYAVDLVVDQNSIENWMESHFPSSFAKNTYYLEDVKHSPMGRHYVFQQMHLGAPVYQAKFKLHVNKAGRAYYIQNGFVPQPQLKYEAGIEGNVWFQHQGYYRLCQSKRVSKHSWMVAYNGLPIHTEEKKLHFHQPDTLVWAQVFLINPLNTAEVSYGGAYQDSSDQDVVAINAERKWVQTRVAFENDTFRLKNERYAITDVFFPSTPETISLTDTFSFTRSQHQFEDINAWYHITTFSDYVDELGYDSALQDTIVIDAHGQGGGDASSFNYGIFPPELEFGEGGVDDAEDGEVVVHEFGHSLSIQAGGETVVGGQRRAMEEGTADYFCVSYSRRYTDFAWKEIFNWDGHNPFFTGVNTGVNKHFPDDLTGSTNSDRELWSSPLVCIYEKLGQWTSDSLILSHLFFQMGNATMPQMAEVILMIDSVQFNRAHYADIKSCFVQYGILNWGSSTRSDLGTRNGLQVINSLGFLNGQGKLEIKHAQNMLQLTVYDVAGQLVYEAKPNANRFFMEPSLLPAGSYTLRVATRDGIEQVKILKL